MAAVFLHDSLAVGVAGARAPFAQGLASTVSGWGAPVGGGSMILGRSDVRLPAAGAAFVNAFQIHGQEFDCVHEPAVVHPLATVVAALLAEAERSGPYDGETFLTALSAGVDVAVGLGLAAKSPLKFFRPATAGIFGCVAALSRLKGLTREAALNAFGYALAFASGTMQAHVEGLPTLPIQVAAAARSSIQAIDLAELGMPGPRGAIEGPFGYLTLFEDAVDLEPVLADLATRPRIVEVSWKPFPTGRAAHGAIVATRRLIAEHGLTSKTLESLTYSAPSLIKRLVGRPIRPDMTVAYARLCFPYLAGVVLQRGAVGLGDFTPERLSDPEIHALAAKVEVISDDNPDPAAFTPARASAKLVGGAEAQVVIEAQLGSPADPLSREEHLAKAKACLAFAGLGDRHGALDALMADFSKVGDVGAAIRMVLAA
jgi:2-methylcitrate dehydratase PrpD